MFLHGVPWKSRTAPVPFSPAGQLSHYWVHFVPGHLVPASSFGDDTHQAPLRKRGIALASSAWLKLFVGLCGSECLRPRTMDSTSTSTAIFSPTFPRQHLTSSRRSQERQSRFKRESWIFYIADETRVWPRWKHAQAWLLSEPCPKSTFPSGPRLTAQTWNLMCSPLSNELDFWVPVLLLPSPGHVFSC